MPENSASSVPKRDKQFPQGSTEIRLLSEAMDEAVLFENRKVELDSQNQVSDAVEELPPVPLEERSMDQAGCLVFGPFLEPSQKDDFAGFFTQSGFKATVEEILVSRQPRYWAYIEPLDSARSALSMMAKIRERGVNAFLIGDGDLVNGLSLGVYEHEEQAKILGQTLVDLGVEIKMTEKSNSYAYYEVVIWPVNDEIPISEILIKVRERYPQVKYRQKDCKSVASVG